MFGPPSFKNSIKNEDFDLYKNNISQDNRNWNYDDDDIVINNYNEYVPMTFIPTITTRGIWSVLGDDVKPGFIFFITHIFCLRKINSWTSFTNLFQF